MENLRKDLSLFRLYQNLSLGARLGMLMVWIVVFSAVTPAAVTLGLSLQKVHEVEAEKATQSLVSLAVRLEEMRNYVFLLPDAILNRYPLASILTDSDYKTTPGAKESVNELPHFSALMEQQFFPVRFLDEVSILSIESGGQETFKAKWINGVPTHIESSATNVTADIPFFLATLQLGGGAVYVDGLSTELKRDGTTDRKLVLTLGQVIFQDDGDPYGVVRVTVDITKWMLEAIQSYPIESQLFIVGENGQVIVRSDQHELFLGGDSIPPEILEAMKHSLSETSTLFLKDSLVGIAPFIIDPSDHTRLYYIGVVSDNVPILENNKSFIVIVLLTTLVISMFAVVISIHISKPIRKMAETIKQIATGESTVEQLHAMRSSPEVKTLIDAAQIMQTSLGEKEAQIRESEYRLTLATNAARLGIWEKSLGDNDHEYWSIQLIELLGFDAQEKPSHLDIVSLINEEDKALFETNITAARDNGARMQCEVRLLHTDGCYRWVYIAGLREPGLPEEPGRIVGTVFDIDARKRAEGTKDEFISIVSHELRTPMTSIMGALAIVLSEKLGELSEKSKDLLTIGENNCKRLLQLIDDILDFEKMKHGKASLHKSEFKLATLLRQVSDQNLFFAQEHGVKLIANEPEHHLVMNADFDKILQVLTNLISNACKFSGPDTTVNVGVKDDGNSVEFFVQDEGPGIPDDFHDSMFSAFTQVESAGIRKTGGTGLGLSIVESIVDLHDGEIRFTTGSTGTVFYVLIPKALGL